jgi:hypothetical protein
MSVLVTKTALAKVASVRMPGMIMFEVIPRHVQVGVVPEAEIELDLRIGVGCGQYRPGDNDRGQERARSDPHDPSPGVLDPL